MSPRFLAAGLALMAACMLAMTGLIIRGAVRERDPGMAVSAVIACAVLGGVLVNAAADLWGAGS